MNIHKKKNMLMNISGGGGIRTRESSTLARFPSVCTGPLCDSSLINTSYYHSGGGLLRPTPTTILHPSGFHPRGLASYPLSISAISVIYTELAEVYTRVDSNHRPQRPQRCALSN